MALLIASTDNHRMEKIQQVLKSAIWVLTGLAIACTLIGIAPAQILLSLALLSFLLDRALLYAGNESIPPVTIALSPCSRLPAGPVETRKKGRRGGSPLSLSIDLRVTFPPIKAPLLIFMGWTLVSYFFSPERALGRPPINKFWLFCIPLIVASEFSRVRILKTYYAIFAAGSLAAVLTIVQYFLLARNTIQYRVTGFMGHWMTLSGEIMLVLICLAAYLVFSASKHRLLLGLLLSTLSFSLALTMTRSVWIATVTGLILLLLMRYFQLKTLLVSAVSVILLGILAPHPIQERMKSVFNSGDPSNYARASIWRAGLRMVKAHPWLGVGPQRVYRVFYDYHPHPEDRYRSGFFPVHLHNNLLQFAAERGIPCALAWLWLMVKLGVDHWTGFRHAHTTPETKSIYAIGFLAVVVLFIAGMFEFNFGDSEVLMIFLFLVSAPYVGDREQGIGDRLIKYDGHHALSTQ